MTAMPVRVDVDGLTVGHLSRSDARRFRTTHANARAGQFAYPALLISMTGDTASDYGVRLDLYL